MIVREWMHPDLGNQVSAVELVGWTRGDLVSEAYRRHASEPSSVLLQAECDGEIVGVAQVYRRNEKFWLEFIVVRYERSGVGSALMNKIVDLAGNDTIWLEAADTAIDFFRGWGFRNVNIMVLGDIST